MRSSTGGRNKVNEVSVVTRLRKLFKNFLEERLHEVIPNMNHSNWITQRKHVGQDGALVFSPRPSWWCFFRSLSQRNRSGICQLCPHECSRASGFRLSAESINPPGQWHSDSKGLQICQVAQKIPVRVHQVVSHLGLPHGCKEPLIGGSPLLSAT